MAFAASSTAPHGSFLSRKELQSHLKAWKRKATGTTSALLEAYETARREIGGGAAASRTPPRSTVAATRTPPTTVAARRVPPPTEKRVKRYRSHPTIGIKQRIDRARTQRLYLVQRSDISSSSNGSKCEFVVLGSTGNVYDVNIAQVPRCSCPDHGKGNLCKHILFIMLKVIGLPSSSPLVYQAAYLQSELEEIFTNLRSRRVGGIVMVNASVTSAFASLQSGKAVVVPESSVGGVARRCLTAGDSDCPICFDATNVGLMSSLTYCRAACGTNFHAACIQTWLDQKMRQKDKTCPNCRQPWQGAAKSGKKGQIRPTYDEGYANLGSLQGQSPHRDTSTYASSPYHYKRGYY
jgi:hypothetical protein